MRMTFTIDALLAAARERTKGLIDFGDERFRPALAALLEAINTESRLSEIGARLMGERLIELLKNRLLMEDYYARHPEIEAEDVDAPLVIVGLPRTGTTLLQRVLSCDPRFQPILWWESRYPVPLPDPETGADRRVDLAKAEVQAMVDANPALLAIHPFDATAADEEGMLLEHSFQSFFDAYVDIPSYTAWQWAHDQTPAYEHLKRMLKFLQWQKRGRGEAARPWVLKTPHHLRQIDVLFKVFPGARVIQTHRDPLQTIPSIASFADNLWKLYMATSDPARAGRQWSDIWARGIAATQAYRDSHAPERFFDVWFADTLSQPLAVVRAIYDYLGLDFPEETQQRMAAFLEANRRENRPLHAYTIDHYGLTEAQIERDFAAYRQRYILPRPA
jgi:hypothetical protein